MQPIEGPAQTLAYDILVMCPGSIARTLPIPGLAEIGIGFKSVAEAVYLRNHVIARMDAAASNTDPEMRRRALTFVFIGGGYAGIEAMAELEDMARDACKNYPDIDPADMRWVMVEASRPHPARGVARRWRTTPSCSCATAASRSCSNTRVNSLTDGHVGARTATSSTRRPWCGPRGCGRTRCCSRPICRSMTSIG